jgi:succinate dehydrogenase flavoprotein subunit
VPRDVAARNAKQVVDSGRGVGPQRNGVFLDFADAILRRGRAVIEDRYGNLFEMYEKITGENPWVTPMRIYPAPHYTMGGLWVDYDLMSTIPGLFVLGEANFSDHGANRLGASALMQGLADGYFIIAYTIGHYFATLKQRRVPTDHAEFRRVEADVAERTRKLLSHRGKKTPIEFHRQIGRLLWEKCGMARNATGLKAALATIPAIREEFWQNVSVPGSGEELNRALEQAGRVGDYLEFGELMCQDALNRNESCGAHFREEYQYPDGEAKRNDEACSYVAAWEFKGVGEPATLHKEPLVFEEVHPTVRSYK